MGYEKYWQQNPSGQKLQTSLKLICSLRDSDILRYTNCKSDNSSCEMVTRPLKKELAKQDVRHRICMAQK